MSVESLRDVLEAQQAVKDLGHCVWPSGEYVRVIKNLLAIIQEQNTKG